jgi:hypothetical protein
VKAFKFGGVVATEPKKTSGQNAEAGWLITKRFLPSIPEKKDQGEENKERDNSTPGD